MKKLTIKKTVSTLNSKSNGLSRESLLNFKGGDDTDKLPSFNPCNADALCASGKSMLNDFSGRPHTNCC